MSRRIDRKRLTTRLGATTIFATVAAAVLIMTGAHHTIASAGSAVLDAASAGDDVSADGAGCKSMAHTAATPTELIQIAICLDTSGSMDGLIEATKQKLWAIVNDLATAEPTPKLEVALLTFGNDGHLTENGWVNIDSPLTTDLDEISRRLFELTTNGGSEYVARVLHKSEALEWDESPSTLKLAIVAGNESAEQDPVFQNREVCDALEAKGILVNSIYCGPAEDDVSTGWRNVAALSGGTFANIDQDDGLVVVETPYDKELAVLSARLNETYIPLGSLGATGAENQSAQDANAASLGVAAQAARGCAKASKLYSCSWDLVDAIKDGKIALETVKDEELPEDMRGLSADERKTYVEAKKSERESVQTEIAELGKKRDAYIKAEIQRAGIDESLSFDAALRAAIRGQAESKGFVFPDEGDRADAGSGAESDAKSDAATVAIAADDLLASSVPVPASPSVSAAAVTQAKLAPPASIALPDLRDVTEVRLDPAVHDVELSAIEALVERAADVRAGNSLDARRVGGTIDVPTSVVRLKSMSDWDLLTRLLGSAGQPSPGNEIWLRLGTRTYLLLGGGC